MVDRIASDSSLEPATTLIGAWIVKRSPVWGTAPPRCRGKGAADADLRQLSRPSGRNQGHVPRLGLGQDHAEVAKSLQGRLIEIDGDDGHPEPDGQRRGRAGVNAPAPSS